MVHAWLARPCARVTKARPGLLCPQEFSCVIGCGLCVWCGLCVYLAVCMFAGMFAHGFNESKAGTINLQDMSYPVFVALVRFLYTDNIPPPSVEAIVLPLLQQVTTSPFILHLHLRVPWHLATPTRAVFLFGAWVLASLRGRACTRLSRAFKLLPGALPVAVLTLLPSFPPPLPSSLPSFL